MKLTSPAVDLLPPPEGAPGQHHPAGHGAGHLNGLGVQMNKARSVKSGILRESSAVS